MSPLDSTPTKVSLEYELASALLEIVPRSMREIRKGLRSYRGTELTVPQFRVLAKLRVQSCTNNELAEHIGLSVAAMSRLVQGLVTKGLLQKSEGLNDRREVRVDLSKKGRSIINYIREMSRQEFAQKMHQLNLQDKKNLQEGFEVLKKLFYME